MSTKKTPAAQDVAECTDFAYRPSWQVNLLQEQERLQKQYLEMQQHSVSVEFRRLRDKQQGDFMDHLNAISQLLRIVTARCDAFA